MLNIAVVGLGFMGVTHLKGWRTVPGVRLHAVVDADERRLTGDLTSVGGNFANTGEKFDFSDVRGYRTLAEALADPAIEAVDICLPTDQHVPATTAALRAGKHVLTEKPISLDAASAEGLIREAEQNNRILMAAHVLRFFPSYMKLAESLGSAGTVRSALFRRRCAAPTWNPWLTDPKRSGGGIMDLLIHDADFCISLWGLPIPPLPGVPTHNRAFSTPIKHLHIYWMIWVYAFVLLLHVAGALKHQFDGHPVLWRMVPFLRRPDAAAPTAPTRL